MPVTNRAADVVVTVSRAPLPPPALPPRAVGMPGIAAAARGVASARAPRVAVASRTRRGVEAMIVGHVTARRIRATTTTTTTTPTTTTRASSSTRRRVVPAARASSDGEAVLYSFGDGGDAKKVAPSSSSSSSSSSTGTGVDDDVGAGTKTKTFDELVRDAMPANDALDKQILKLFVPAMLNFLIIPMVGAVDVFWVGRMGSAVALASQGAANQVFQSAFWIISFVPSIIAPVVAKAAASGDTEEVQRATGEAIFVASLVGVFGMALLTVFRADALSVVGVVPGSGASRAYFHPPLGFNV